MSPDVFFTKENYRTAVEMIPALVGSQEREPPRSSEFLEFLIPSVHFYLTGCHRHVGCTCFSKIPTYGIR